MLIIRQAACADAEALAELETECFPDPWSVNTLRDSMENPLYTFLLAEDNGKTLGYIGAYTVAGETQITNVAVTDSARRQGIGGALLDDLINDLRGSSTDSVTLEVRASNLPAQALYRSRGFTEVGRRKHFYSRPTEDGILMTLYLQGK